MKFSVTFKTADALMYALQDLTQEDRERAEEFAEQFVKYGEQIDLDFDVLAGTVTVRRIGATSEKTEAEKFINIVCEECGSTDVHRDATAAWSTELQMWELCGIMDQGYCNDCDSEANLKEIPL